jgi:type II secretory pathway component PulF
MKDEDLIALNEEIAGMARAGLPLDQGLAAMARDMVRGDLKRATMALADDLRAGHTLPEALAKQPHRVPSFYASLVTAGIRSGRIADVLATLSLYARSVASVRATIREALYYPATVLAFGILLFLGYGFVVLPMFAQVFEGFEVKLPAVTRGILIIFEQPLLFIVCPFTLLTLAVLVGMWLARRNDEGRRAGARLLYAMPIIGTLVRSARLAAFAELLAILVDHEVPLPEAFFLAGSASSDPLMDELAEEVQQQLSLGMPLREALRGRGLVPEWVAWMAGLGEQRGTLAASLRQVSAVYRRQVETRAALLRTVLPPFLIIVTAGLFVALFVFTVMSPMYGLLNALSQ